MGHRQDRSGFTLIELLVSIGIIALLIAIAIPSFAQIRRNTQFAKSLSSSRQIMGMLAMYTESNRDTHPYIVSGQLDGLRPALDDPLGPYNGLAPGVQMNRWANLMVDQNPGLLDLIYPDIAFWPDMRARNEEGGHWQGVILATNTLFAAPAYFSNTEPVQEHQLRATRTNEIQFPSAKMIFYDWSSTWLHSQRALNADIDGLSLRQTYAFADGSADAILGKDFNAPFVERVFTMREGPGFTTIDGLAGRDR